MISRVKAVAIDYGGSLTARGGPLAGGSRPVDPGCAGPLRLLAARCALVLSSNTSPGIDRAPALEAAGIAGLFRAVLSSGCLRMAKPDPGFYAMIAAAAGCQPGQVLHVGNNITNDITGPASCGMRTALIRPAGLAPGERDLLPAGTLVISHLRELPALLASLSPAVSIPDSPEPAWNCPVCGCPPEVPHPGPAPPERMGLLLDWLNANHHRDDVRVADIAAAAGVSQRRLQAICKNLFGRTPTALLADVRMTHVHRALHGQEPAPASLGDAARMAGFNRISRFKAAYRARFGTGPVLPPPGAQPLPAALTGRSEPKT